MSFKPLNQFAQRQQHNNSENVYNNNKYSSQQTDGSGRPGSRYLGITLPILSKFGMIFDIFEEQKVGGDGTKYTLYSIMTKVIPGKRPGEYDHDNAFSMKIKIDDLYALSGALMYVYHGLPVEFNIYTDSSKSQYSKTNTKKSIYVVSKDDRTYFGFSMTDGTNKVNDSISIDPQKAYAYAKMIERFCDKFMEIQLQQKSR